MKVVEGGKVSCMVVVKPRLGGAEGMTVDQSAETNGEISYKNQYIGNLKLVYIFYTSNSIEIKA